MDPNIIKLGDTISRTVFVPVISAINPVDDITVELTIPTGFAVSTATPDIGSFVGTTWTIATLPADTSGTLELVLEASVECPTGKTLTATISTTEPGADNDPSDNVTTLPLDYLTCCDITACGDSRTDVEGNAYKIQLEGDEVGLITPRGGVVRSGISFTDAVDASTGFVGLNDDPALVVESADAVLVGVGGTYINITPGEVVVQGVPITYGTDFVPVGASDRTVPDVGFVRKLVGTVDRGITTVNTDVNSHITIPHSLGAVPTYVQATAVGTGIFQGVTWIDTSSDAANIVISVYDLSGQVVVPPGTPVTVSWEARIL